MPDEGLVSVFDATHGRALMRITGARAADLLSKVCGVDLSEKVTPDGAAFRSSVAKLVTDVVRDEPNPDLLSWQSVKATLVLHFPGSNS